MHTPAPMTCEEMLQRIFEVAKTRDVNALYFHIETIRRLYQAEHIKPNENSHQQDQDNNNPFAQYEDSSTTGT